MKRHYLIGLACALALSAGTGCARKPSEVIWETAGIQTEEAYFAEVQTETAACPAKIVVDICGAVVRPGVYELEEGMRVCDAVEAAGGLLEDADQASLNQAAVLQDAEKICVYTREEAAQGISGQTSGNGGSGKVNINTADTAQLCTLSGIGASRAADIIAYREANGGFQSIEDIMNVSGIKEATFQKIRDEIAVR